MKFLFKKNSKKFKIFIFFLIFFFPHSLAAHHKRIFNPGNMGPNAMPIQPIRRTNFDPKNILYKLGWKENFQKGKNWEFTQNPLIEIFFPLGKISAVQLYWEFFEKFSTSETLKYNRNAKNQKGKYNGDLYFGQSIQILRESSHTLDLTFNVMTKSTTGKGEKDLRHINAPGYIFDMTAGKTINELPFINALKFSGYISFIAWQTDIGEQNDAPGYNGQISFFWDHSSFDASLAGYYGWQKNFDNPLVYRLGWNYLLESGIISLQYTKGLKDFIHNSIQIEYTFFVNHYFPNIL